MLTQDRLIVALDVPSAAQARQLVQSIGESATTYKIGKQLFTAEGPQLVRELVASGRKVFLDLKFHDIPNTVAGAVRSAAELKVSMLTVHASGGSKMLRRPPPKPLPSPRPSRWFWRSRFSPAWRTPTYRKLVSRVRF